MATSSGKGASANGSVYVCNLPQGTDENMLAEYFGTIGLLKVSGLISYYSQLLFALIFTIASSCFIASLLLCLILYSIINRKTSERVDLRYGFTATK